MSAGQRTEANYQAGGMEKFEDAGEFRCLGTEKKGNLHPNAPLIYIKFCLETKSGEKFPIYEDLRSCFASTIA